MIRMILTFVILAAIIVVLDQLYTNATKREKRLLHGKMKYVVGVGAVTLLILSAIVAIF